VSLVQRLRQSRQAQFLLLAVSIYLVDSLAIRMATDPGHRTRIAVGASIDLVLVVGLLYYWLLVRPGLRPRSGLIFVGVIGLLRASFLFPEGTMVKLALAGCAEIGLIAFVGTRIVRRSASKGRATLGSADPIAALQRAVEVVIPFPPVAHAAAKEMSVLYYAVRGWRARPHIPSGMRAFVMQEQTDKAFMLAAVAIASVFEIVPVHLLVHRWSVLASWILTGLSLYGLVWLLGLSRSLVLRPTLIGSESVVIRYGLLAQMEVGREEIAGVERVVRASAAVSVLPRRATPNLELSFTHPIKMKGLFISRSLSRIALAVQDPGEFEMALAAVTGTPL
jgi:hypothetical protein